MFVYRLFTLIERSWVNNIKLVNYFVRVLMTATYGLGYHSQNTKLCLAEERKQFIYIQGAVEENQRTVF